MRRSAAPTFPDPQPQTLIPGCSRLDPGPERGDLIGASRSRSLGGIIRSSACAWSDRSSWRGRRPGRGPVHSCPLEASPRGCGGRARRLELLAVAVTVEALRLEHRLDPLPEQFPGAARAAAPGKGSSEPGTTLAPSVASSSSAAMSQEATRIVGPAFRISFWAWAACPGSPRGVSGSPPTRARTCRSRGWPPAPGPSPGHWESC